MISKGIVDKTMSYAEKQCKSNGSRLTEKRKQVLLALIQSGKAVSAYDLMDYCQVELGESIQAMSMYRILDFLEQEELVHKLSTANKYIACSHITCTHEHGVPQFLICEQCQIVKEITISESIIKQLKQNVEEAGFYLNNPRLEMSCICDDCKQGVA